ncbi:MAG: hypothetical protein WDZ49_17040, partial [Litorilinea sp.]
MRIYWWSLVVAMLLIWHLGGETRLLAQSSSNFRMEKSVMDGGSLRMAASDFGMAGTIGQKDNAVMASGSFVLHGGFWPGLGAQMPDPTDPDPTDPDPTDPDQTD